MSKSISALVILLLFLFFSCSKKKIVKIDNSNPKSVLEACINYTYNDTLYSEAYKLISSKSQEKISENEFVKYFNTSDIVRSVRDSLRKILNFSFIISDIPSDVSHPGFKRFKVDYKGIINSDTTRYKQYYTLINENGIWRVIWIKTLLNVAIEKRCKSDFEGALKILNELKEVTSFNGDIFNEIASVYYYNNNLNIKERKDGMIKNIKYAISLEPDMSHHYSTLAAYYDIENNPDLQIENYLKAIELCLNEEDKRDYFGNLSIKYENKKDFEKAQYYINKAIALDSNDTFSWLRYARLLNNKKKYSQANDIFEKAVNLKPMDNTLQSELLAAYAENSFQLKNYEKAKKYILKALELNPSDEYLQYLYKQIKLKTKD